MENPRDSVTEITHSISHTVNPLEKIQSSCNTTRSHIVYECFVNVSFYSWLP